MVEHIFNEDWRAVPLWKWPCTNEALVKTFGMTLPPVSLRMSTYEPNWPELVFHLCLDVLR